MYLQQIDVEGFGTLSQCRISGLTEGLNVIHGVNGSGKTTLMHFLKGIFSGFDEARRLRLLPPLKQGVPGGRITVRTSQGRFEVIRHARVDNSDTLAISLLEGSPDDVTAFRKSLKSLSRGITSTLTAVSGFTATDLDGLLHLAKVHGIELSSRSNSAAWISAKVREMESERAELFRTAPQRGALIALEQEKEQLEKQLAATRTAQLQQLEQWQTSLRDLREKIQRLMELSLWQDSEIQSLETDLTEVQNRLWSTREKTVQEVERTDRPSSPRPSEWQTKITAIDQEIAHAQQVLRDLAASRMSLSVSSADFAGVEVPDLMAVLQRQRSSLSDIESQTDAMLETLSLLENSSTCLCTRGVERLKSDIEAIRQQVWLICQELGRQQAAHQQSLLSSQREGIDRCEHELIRQIQRLRLRKEELLQQCSTTNTARIASRSLHEAYGCQCDGHEDAVREAAEASMTSSTVPQVIVRERVVTVSDVRPGDAEREIELIEQRQRMRQRRQETVQQLRLARIELQQLELGAREFAGDRSAQALLSRLVKVEQQLADAREQWQSLTLLQAVLQRTQQKLNEETNSPVLEQASEYLSRMTDGRYVRLRWNRETRELRIVNAANAELAPNELSRGTLEQTVLSFRLALCREFQRRGIQLPLILDDVLVDSDEQRLQAAVEVLMDFATTYQVIFLTCQQHLLNLFATRQVQILALPGSSTRAATAEIPQAPTPRVEEPVAQTSPSSHQLQAGETVRDRVQPDLPYWLQASSPISHVPSLGEQMSRRLGTLGVRTVGELVELDPETAEMPLDSLQISAATLRNWQAEGRLLCCVPDLTGRDAQLLVACGIFSPAELAECVPTNLLNRIRRQQADQTIRQTLTWLSHESDWPTMAQVEHWIRCGKKARSWKEALDWAAIRKIHLRQHQARNRSHSGRSMLLSEPSLRMSSLRPRSEETTRQSSWKFYLHLDSPIVDAPSIGPRTAQRLQRIGIERVSHLLNRNADEIARSLNRRRITEREVQAWQQQASLMCRVPQLRGHDVQILVHCGIVEPDVLASKTPEELFAIVEPFVTSSAGARVLRSSRVPDLKEVSEWISFARQSRSLRAA